MSSDVETPDLQRCNLRCTVDDVTTHGFAMRRDLSQGERMAKTGKIFGIFFFAACLTVFVPILHFILPPLLLLIGGFLAASEYMATGEVRSGEIACPNCKAVIKLPHENEDWPRVQRCPSCSFTLRIEKE